MIRRISPISIEQEAGFSLIEVIVVIIITGILLTVALGSGKKITDTARTEQTLDEMDRLAVAIAGEPDSYSNGIRANCGYVGDVGSLPPNLAALKNNPGSYSTWNGPYIENRFEQTPTDYQKDAWQADYIYSGGVTLSSVGSGETITRQFAGSADELLYNQVQGNVFDSDGDPPGNIFRDSITVRLSYPDGTGGYTLASGAIDNGGFFRFDSVPIGNHDLTFIYLPTDDTIQRFVSVYPNADVYEESWLPFTTIDTTTSGPTGGSGVEILRPVGNGSQSSLETENCSNGWQCVDEVSADGNGSYVKGNSNQWRYDTYATEDHTTGAGSIDSVRIVMVAQGSHSSMRVRTRIRTNGSNYSGSQVNPSSSYNEYATVYTNNPNTWSAWTWTEIDAIEIGVGIRREARVTQVWIEIYYTN